MLDEMGEEAFAERYVHWTLEPWGMEWYMTAALATTIANEIRAALLGSQKQKFGGHEYPVKNWIKVHIPEYAYKPKRVKRHIPIREAEQHFAHCLAKD